MPTAHDIRDQIAKLDEQIISLLEERVSLYEDMKDDEDEESDAISDTIANWEEMAEEKGWSPLAMNKICRGVIELCKTATE